MASEERRKDVGLKLVYVVLTALVTFLLSIIFFETYRKAESALNESNILKVRMGVMEECVRSTNGLLTKIDIKVDKLLGWNK
jgi:hypothetical protein